MGWVELIYFIVALILSVALAPKPPDAKAAAFDDFDFPIAEEGREIPVIFGEVELKGANTLWYGSLGWVKIKKRSGFSKTTIGYKYYLAFHLGLCHGPVDEVTRVTVGDKPFWSGSIGPGNGSGSGDFPDLFGGDKQEGGVSGSFDIMMGAADQAVNENLTRQLFAGVWRDRIPAPHTAYRGILGFYWRRGYIGTTKYPKPWAITARRHSANWQDGTVWYPTKLRINSKAFNGAHIIYECMTNKEWGRGLPILRMNAATFEAAADQLYDEDFGLRLNWNQGLTIEGFIQVILDHIAGVLVWRTSTSQFELHLIRNNYVLADLPTLDESNVVSVEDFQRNAWGETVNELQLKYIDPDSAKDVAITVHDLANIQIQGGTNTDTVDLPGIRDHELAKRVAIRELNARSNPLAKVILIANRTVHGFYQGQVVKFSWEKYGIVDMPIRILKLNKGTLDKGRIRIEAVQDIFSLDTITYLVVPPAEDPPDDPAPPTDDDDNNASVISTALTSPPSNPADGDRYYVQPGTGTGAWEDLSGLVEWDEEATVNGEGEYTGGWIEVELPEGTPFYDQSTDRYVHVDPAGETAPIVPPTLQRTGATWVRGSDEIEVPTNVVYVHFPRAAEIERITLIGAPSGSGGSCVVDIWKSSTFPPVVADSITASAKPTLTTGNYTVEDETLTGWTKTINADEYLAFNLDSNTGFRFVSIQVFVKEI